MAELRSVADVIKAIPPKYVPRLPTPTYTRARLDTCLPDADGRPRLGLAVSTMQQHTSDEGWQIFAGLEANGWTLCGHGLPHGDTAVLNIIRQHRPGVVLVQDEREWDLAARDFRDPCARFYGTDELAKHPDIFKLTILKDSHQRPQYHSESAARMGCHAWVVYYHPSIVEHLAPYARPQHFVRTWHSIDPAIVPPWKWRRPTCIVSGAVSAVYPLRKRIFEHFSELPFCYDLRHPGYHRRGCCTPEYMRMLAGHRVSICTSSIYGYALRKIVESTACGCTVVTDLPTDEVMPGGIDGNLVRVHPDIPIPELAGLIKQLYAEWDERKQHHYSEAAKSWYDYRSVTKRLADNIEELRRRYP